LDNRVGLVWSMLKEWRNTTHNREALTSIDLVMFLMLTGLRINEAATLKWAQVHLDDGWFHLPNPKNGNAVSLPLSTQAVELLKLRHKPDATGYAFASSWNKTGHSTDPRYVMDKVSQINGSHLTPHSLRRTWTNISLRNCRIEKFRTDLLSNHLTRDVVSAHYFDTSNLQWLRPEAQAIADWIQQASDQSSGANIIQAKFA
jgi:integrase